VENRYWLGTVLAVEEPDVTTIEGAPEIRTV
jgi:hypothetical protein